MAGREINAEAQSSQSRAEKTISRLTAWWLNSLRFIGSILAFLCVL